MKKRPLSLRRGIHIKHHLRFLRPGALARMRDSKLISLSVQRSVPFILISPPPSPPHQESTATAADQHPAGSPCFLLQKLDGPICPQRKKLSASKYVLFVPPSPDLADAVGVADLLGSDLVAAH